MGQTPVQSEKSSFHVSWTEALRASFKLWIKDIRYYFPIYLAIQAFTIGLVYVLLFVSGFNPWIVYIASSIAPVANIDLMLLLSIPIDPITLGFMIAFVGIFLISTVVGVLATGIVMKHAWDQYSGREPTIGTSFAFAKTRYLSLLGVVILMTAITVGLSGGSLLLLFGVIIGGLFTIWLNPILYFILIIAAVIGTFLLFIVLMFIIVRLTVSQSAVVLDSVAAREGLGQSWGLTRGRFWGTFGFTMILGMITAAASGIIIAVQTFNILFPLPAFFAIIYSVLYAIAMSFAAPLGAVGQAMYYQHLYSEQPMKSPVFEGA